MGSVPWLLVIPSPYWLLVTCPFACVCHVIPRVNWKTKSCLGTTALTSRATTKGWKSTHSWPVGEALAILAEQTGSVGSGLELWWIMVVVCCCDMWCIRTPVKSIQPYQAMFQTCCHTIQSIRFLFFFCLCFLMLSVRRPTSQDEAAQRRTRHGIDVPSWYRKEQAIDTGSGHGAALNACP